MNINIPLQGKVVITRQQKTTYFRVTVVVLCGQFQALTWFKRRAHIQIQFEGASIIITINI